MLKRILVSIFSLFFVAAANANPCEDFVEVNKVSAPMFHKAGSKLCLIDKRLADETKFVSKHVVMTESHGQMEFLMSENGNLAVVADVLSILGNSQNSHGAADRAVGIIREVVDCVRDPACREIVRDFVRDYALGEMVDRVIDNVSEYFSRD